MKESPKEKNHKEPAQQKESAQAPEAPPAQEAQDAAKLEGVLKDMEAKAKEIHDKYLLAMADLDNYRKRAQREKIAAVEEGQLSILKGLLPIVDNVERALGQLAADEQAKTVREGLQLILRQSKAYLESLGLKPFDCVGQIFDPHKHEAVLHVPSKEHPDHAVLEEIQKGYEWRGRIVRHALVKVADNPQEQGKEKKE